MYCVYGALQMSLYADKLLIDQLAGVDIDQLHDEWAEAHGVQEPPEPVLAVDLMAVLEASIRASGKQ